ncbi:MAG: hypothetical protein KDC82_04095 [Bacteroidetes bacterium]|nr:hypothetical protein [Bacteroidota bacterium]
MKKLGSIILVVVMLQACKSSAVVSESTSKNSVQENTSMQEESPQMEEEAVKEPSVSPASKVLTPVDKTKMQAIPVKKVETKTN